MRNVYIYKNYNNITVLIRYLEIIKNAFEKCGYTCQYVDSMDCVDKRSIVVFPMAKDAFKYYIQGYKTLIVWQQGVTADESYMRHQSIIRKIILNCIDCFMMKKSKMVFFVSESMKKHYEKLSKSSFDEKSYVMPCYNEELDDSIFYNKDYSQYVFSYVGSLDLWQCFNEVVSLYKEIEKRIPNSRLKVLTFDVEKGKNILEREGIKNFSIKRVPKEEVVEELKEVKYGFVLREDNIVNKVATPTKFSSYLSAGVIPIFSKCLVDFYELAKNNKYTIAIDSMNVNTNLIDKLCMEISIDEIRKEYKEIFNTYYNTNLHTDNITKLIRKVF